MNNIKATNWQTFKETLLKNPALHLQFQYAANSKVNASYHITEIKQATITSVDCGGQLNAWTEIILQLWEPADHSMERAMQVSKALSIIQLVEKSMPLHPLATVKIEFGNSQFDTRQMYPNEFLIDGDNLTINLIPDFTQCKAIDRGGNCGIAGSGEECFAPVVTHKPKIQLVNLANATETCCTPGGGCC